MEQVKELRSWSLWMSFGICRSKVGIDKVLRIFGAGDLIIFLRKLLPKKNYKVNKRKQKE